ncbi:MAG: hypothetical protein Q9195_006413 [Heterodermia aff. obscurata]
MSDPLSVAAGVLGIITAAAQISSLLTRFTKNVKDAPEQAHVILTDVTDTSRILSHLQVFVLDAGSVSQSKTCLLHIESVVAIVTGCVATFSELQRLLESLRLDGMTVLDRLKWTRDESSINALGSRLQTHKASLSLMLDVLNGNTMQEIKTTVERLDSTVADNYQDILKRVQALEMQQSLESSQLPLQIEPPKFRWSIATVPDQIPATDDESVTKRSSRLFNFKFEQDLSGSRVYKNIAFQGSTSSLLSTDEPASRWSTISDLTVADIMSQMSVLNLAITSSEVYNPQQYQFRPPKLPTSGRLRAVWSRRRARETMSLSTPLMRAMGTSSPVKEFCRSSGASITDLCPDVLYLAFKIYFNFSTLSKASFRKSASYALYVVHQDKEHCFGSDERPLAVFDELDRAGHSPNFMVKMHTPPISGYDEPMKLEPVGILKKSWVVDENVFFELCTKHPTPLWSTAMVYKLPGSQLDCLGASSVQSN